MTAVQPRLETRGRWHRVRGPVLLAGGLLAASIALHLRDPHRSGSWGTCPWLLLTGTYCPGCGGLRAVNDLTDGQVGAAASSNLLFVGSLPFVAFWWTRSVVDPVARHAPAGEHPSGAAPGGACSACSR